MYIIMMRPRSSLVEISMLKMLPFCTSALYEIRGPRGIPDHSLGWKFAMLRGETF